MVVSCILFVVKLLLCKTWKVIEWSFQQQQEQQISLANFKKHTTLQCPQVASSYSRRARVKMEKRKQNKFSNVSIHNP